MVCIVGKTPKEEGDNKIFVENVHVLNIDNVQMLAQQLSLGKVTEQKNAAPEKTIPLTMTRDQLKACSEGLKTVFSRYPGQHTVYIRVGNDVIRAQATIGWNKDVESFLKEMVGEESVSVVE